MGVLSRLFGEKAGQNAMMLEEPLDADEVIEESERRRVDPDEIVAYVLMAITVAVCRWAFVH